MLRVTSTMKMVILGILMTLLPAPGGGAAVAPAPDRAELLSQLEARTDVQHEMLLRDSTALFQCGIRVLGRDGRTLYTWLVCGDYRTGPHAALLSGSALPAVVRLDAQGEVVRVRFPRQQSLRADIERMFPPRLQELAIEGNLRTRPSAAALLGRAEDTAPRPPGAR
jgi:hypothetical protein